MGAGEPIKEEDPNEDPSEEEGELIEEEDLEEDPIEDEEEPMEEDGSIEGEVEFIAESDLMEEAVGSEDKGVEHVEGRSETEIMTFPWRWGTCGRMYQGMCPLDAPNQ